MSISPDQAEFFDKNGYLVIENAFGEAELDRLREGLAELEKLGAAADGSSERFIFHLFGGDGGGRRVQQVMEPHEFGGDFIRLARDPRILDVIAGLLGDNLLLYYSMLMMKPPSTGAPAPWHQDMAFFAHDKARLIAAQVYLDDSTVENGCVRVVPGSHRYGLLNHFDGDTFTGVAQGDTRPYDAAALPLPCKAGSIAIWHCLTLHASHPNRSQKSRRAVVFEYKDPSAGLLAGKYKGEVNQVGLMVRGIDPKGELLPSF